MAIISNVQRMPITGNERGDADAHSSRAGVDLHNNVNNLKLYVTAPVLIPNNLWEDGGKRLTLVNGSTNERYMAKWPMLPFAWGITQVRFMLRSAVAGGGTVTLRLYSDTRPYAGLASAVSLASQFSGSQANGPIIVSSAVFVWQSATFAPLRRAWSAANPDPELSLTLTGTSSDLATSCGVQLLAAWGV